MEIIIIFSVNILFHYAIEFKWKQFCDVEK